MHITARKDHFSRAVVRAVAAAAGIAATVPEHDHNSNDITLSADDAGGQVGGRLDVQLKCTHTVDTSGESFTYDLPVSDYNHLRMDVTFVPRALVLVHVPEDPDEWLACDPAQIVLQRCAYWVSLPRATDDYEHVHRGRHDPDRTSVRCARPPGHTDAARCWAMTDDRISEFVRPETAELYLMARGWEARRRTPAFSTWSRDDQENVALFLPLSREPDDFELRLDEFVGRLARIEGLDLDTITTNLRYAASDLVRVRLVSPRVGAGELPIRDGAKLFEGTRDLMQAAACAAVDPRASYGSKKPGTVVDYLNGVRLGQTERGSYIVTVISDVTPEDQGSLLPNEAAHLQVPFERRVTTQLVQALDAARDTAARVLEGESITIFEDAVEQGVSSNLCDALHSMGDESVSSMVEVTVDWAISRPPAVEERQITLEPKFMPVFSDAARTLKQHGPFEDVEVVGIVGQLDRGADDEVGTIVIEGTAQETRRNVRIELGGEQYHKAVEAHDAKRTVSVRGTLSKDGKSWTLIDPGPLRYEA